MQTKFFVFVGLLALLLVTLYVVLSLNGGTEQEQKKISTEVEEVENITTEVDMSVTPTESPSEPMLNSEELTQPEEIVCPNDIKTCPSGGFGVPDSTTYLRRVPPTCEFPECPG